MKNINQLSTKKFALYLTVVLTLFATGCSRQGSVNGNIISIEEALGNIEEVCLSKYLSLAEIVPCITVGNL